MSNRAITKRTHVPGQNGTSAAAAATVGDFVHASAGKSSFGVAVRGSAAGFSIRLMYRVPGTTGYVLEDVGTFASGAATQLVVIVDQNWVPTWVVRVVGNTGTIQEIVTWEIG
mgnify:CR=1 FL=1